MSDKKIYADADRPAKDGLESIFDDQADKRLASVIARAVGKRQLLVANATLQGAARIS